MHFPSNFLAIFTFILLLISVTLSMPSDKKSEKKEKEVEKSENEGEKVENQAKLETEKGYPEGLTGISISGSIPGGRMKENSILGGITQDSITGEMMKDMPIAEIIYKKFYSDNKREPVADGHENPAGDEHGKHQPEIGGGSSARQMDNESEPLPMGQLSMAHMPSVTFTSKSRLSLRDAPSYYGGGTKDYY